MTGINAVVPTAGGPSVFPPNSDLRHTYASYAIVTCQILAVAGKLLGHADIASTERYAHLDGAYLSAAADRVSAIVASMIGINSPDDA